MRCLAQCTAALEPRREAPTDAVGTHSCIGRTSDSIASAKPASPLAGQCGPARLDAKLSYPSAIRLRDFHPPHRFRFVGSVQQSLPKGRPVLLQIVAKLIDRHPVAARPP